MTSEEPRDACDDVQHLHDPVSHGRATSAGELDDWRINQHFIGDVNLSERYKVIEGAV